LGWRAEAMICGRGGGRRLARVLPVCVLRIPRSAASGSVRARSKISGSRGVHRVVANVDCVVFSGSQAGRDGRRERVVDEELHRAGARGSSRSRTASARSRMPLDERAAVGDPDQAAIAAHLDALLVVSLRRVARGGIHLDGLADCSLSAVRLSPEAIDELAEAAGVCLICPQTS